MMNFTELLKKHNIPGNARLIEIELRRIAFERRLDMADDATRPAIQQQLDALPKANGFARMDAEYLLERERGRAACVENCSK
jgi:hypothetical protein